LKDKYSQLVNNSSGVPVFFNPWWLDAVCGDGGWDAFIFEQQGLPTAICPLPIERKVIWTFSRMPIFTPRLGIWLLNKEAYDADKNEVALRQAINSLHDKIDSFSWFEQAFIYRVSDTQILSQAGFEYFEKSTFIFENIANPQKIFNGFDRSKKRNLNKASGIYQVKRGMLPEDFYSLYKSNLEKENKKIGFTMDEVQPVLEAAKAHGAGEVFYAITQKGAVEAATFVLWDDKSAYYLLLTASPLAKSNGVVALLIKELIEFFSEKVTQFDFCGSVIQGVAENNRRFGASKLNYYQVYQVKNTFLKLYRNSLKKW